MELGLLKFLSVRQDVTSDLFVSTRLCSPVLLFVMFCFLVFGNRYMGACDYFTYNGGEFYVNARMYHIQFCPLSVDQAVLKLPAFPDRGITITQMNGIAWRCFFWAALRSYTCVASTLLLILALFLMSSKSTFILFLTLAIIGYLIFAVAWLYKPKASSVRIEQYIRMMSPQSTPQAPHQIQPLDKSTPKKTQMSHFVDIMRPNNHYQSLGD